MPARVLVVDDEPQIRRLIERAFVGNAYEVVAAGTAAEGLTRLQQAQPDVVLLDVQLPDQNGLQLCRRIRAVSAVPIIMLTGMRDEADVVAGLQAGADDYVTKPFRSTELAARMAAVLRRCQQARVERGSPVLRVGALAIDQAWHQVTMAGRPVPLTKVEFRLLEGLALNAGRVVPYARLIEYVWGYAEEHRSACLKPHISHLRRKLGLSAAAPEGIRSSISVGYRLTGGGAASSARSGAPPSDAPRETRAAA